MLARPPAALCSVRGSLARNHGLLLVSVRPNSSLSGEPDAPKDAPVDPAAPVKRSVPKADIFGDIVIPKAFSRDTRRPPRQASRTSSSPDLSWLSDDEFDGGASLAVRLARRRASDLKGHSRTPEQTYGLRQGGDATAPRQRTDTTKQPRVQRQDRERPRWNNGRVDERRTPEGDMNAAVQQSSRGSGERQNDQRERRDRERPRVAQDWRSRDSQAQNSQMENRRLHMRDRQGGQKQAPKAAGPPAKPASVRKEPIKASTATPASLPMPIQTTDLDKLFGPATDSRPAAAAIDVDASSPTSASARRIQYILENSGGDYSRYLPADLGTTFPETLGPLGGARLVLGRRRDVGLKTRRNGLGIVQQMVVQTVVPAEKQATV